MKETKTIIVLSKDATKRKVVICELAPKEDLRTSAFCLSPLASNCWVILVEGTYMIHEWDLQFWHKVAILLLVFNSCRVILRHFREYFMQKYGNDSASNARKYERVCIQSILRVI